jgi:hypothetical protein
MATVTERPVVIHQGDVWVEVVYDDVTMQLATVTTHNPFPTPIGRVRLSRANGTVVFDGPIPVGDITRTITGNVRVDQFNIYATDG